ncbi:hypothetical protein EBB07_28215 [Paenibacillaceae bacterium]|nr:hypothetical protein EBB07_28215 [Paenibacillaceae bacterium]
MAWKEKIPITKYNKGDELKEKLGKIRGIKDLEKHLNPTTKELHSPYLLRNIEKVKERIMKAIFNNENISLHADIDADGENSTAIIFNYLINFTKKVKYFHAQRSEGHGVHLRKDEVPENTDLLIVLDSSSNEWEACKEISERGIDIIIIDHHEVNVENDYCILLNDKHKDCNYPNKHTSGSLLAWKVCQVLDDHFLTSYSDDLIDLAGIGLHSDQMSMLKEENRYIVKSSLENVKNPGVKAILKVLKKDTSKLTSTDYSFGVTPFLNAASRMDKIEMAIELLTTKDEKYAEKLARELQAMNEERKIKQKAAIERIVPAIDLSSKCIIIVDETLGKNMNGLIASDIANKFKRPVIVLGKSAENDDEFHGSFRSFAGFNFLSFVGSMPEVLFSGGHPGAGGVGIKRNTLDAFQLSLNKGLNDVRFDYEVEYDFAVNVSDITEKLINDVAEFAKVSGNECPEPKFLIKDLYIVKKDTIGKNLDTLKASGFAESATWAMKKSDLESKKPNLTVLKFRVETEYLEEFPIDKTIDVIGNLNLNEWKVFKPKFKIEKTKQVFIDDYR